MANEKVPDPTKDSLVAEARAHQRGKIKANSLRNINIESSTNGARNGDLGIPPVAPGTINSSDYSLKQRNEELADKLSSFYAYTIGSPRELNSAESRTVGLPIYGNVPGNEASNFRYVKFYANRTECEAWPNIENYAEFSPIRTLLENSYPEAIYDVNIFGEIPSGQIVKIEYKDKINNRSPQIVEILNKQCGTIQDVSTQNTIDTRGMFVSPPSSTNVPSGHELSIYSDMNNISRAARQVGTLIYRNFTSNDEVVNPEKGNRGCTILQYWQEKYPEKFKLARTARSAARYAPLKNIILNISRIYNLDYENMKTIAFIETSFLEKYVKAQEVNEKTNATGLFQILKSFAKDGPRPVYDILTKDLGDPFKNASAVAKRLSFAINKMENESYKVLQIEKLQPWQIYAMHNQGPDGFAVEYIACKYFSHLPPKVELMAAAQFLFDNGYGPIKTRGKGYHPKTDELNSPSSLTIDIPVGDQFTAGITGGNY